MSLKHDPEWFSLAGPGLEGYRGVLPAHDVKTRRSKIDNLFRNASYTPPEDIGIEVYETPSFDGHQVAIYHVFKKQAAQSSEPGPALVFMHGGGYISVSAKQALSSIVPYVQQGGVPAFSVDYRLAPENPYPAPLEDCWAALLHVQSQAAKLNVDPKRIAIFGESAGGGLAAGLALLSRDRGFSPPVAKQILLYPMIDDRTAEDKIDGLGIFSINDVITGWGAYLGDAYGTDKVSPYAAAARVSSVEGLPPLYLDVGQLDNFAQENIDYAARFLKAKVEAEVHLYPGVIHGFQRWGHGSYVVRQAMANRIRAITTI
ncbi:hypothetical protein F66182_2497 [Fusarium sp. NRRL 66182]|nr:hypothetical protein F66182_2497 [Fusarium sp. NRRL 66182]